MSFKAYRSDIPGAPRLKLPGEPLTKDWPFGNHMKSQHQQNVELFMRAAGQQVPEKACMPSQEVRLLRARLILEEALETVKALGFQATIDTGLPEGFVDVAFQDVVFDPIKEGPDLIEIADGCADISVVTIGTLSACGIPDVPILDEVDHNNWLKIVHGHKDEKTGKWIKPRNHPKPELLPILKEHGYKD